MLRFPKKLFLQNSSYFRKSRNFRFLPNFQQNSFITLTTGHIPELAIATTIQAGRCDLVDRALDFRDIVGGF